MDTEEIYRRGRADAERGEPDPFYYQHYYPYRRGYDQTRRRLRQPLPWQRRNWTGVVVLLVLLLTAGSAAALILRNQPSDTARRPTPTPAAVRTSQSTLADLEEITPLPTDTLSTPSPVVLQVGGHAVVAHLQGQILNARAEPRLKARIRARLKQGDEVRIAEGPVQADGFTWWRIESPKGSGWSAEKSAEGAVWLQPVAP